MTSTVRITTGTKRQGSRPGTCLRLDLTRVMPIPGDARELLFSDAESKIAFWALFDLELKVVSTLFLDSVF